MAPDDIVELFSVFGPVDVRRMFGGLGIYADGTMFALVVDGTIYLKAGDGNRAMFEREELEPFSYSRGGKAQVIMSYRRMPDCLYDVRTSWRSGLAPRWRQRMRRASARKAHRGNARRAGADCRAGQATFGGAGGLTNSGSASLMTRLRPLRLAA